MHPFTMPVAPTRPLPATCRTVRKKEELQKKLDAVYTQLGDGTIQPMAAAPGADVRKTFASNCLTLHYWILQSVKVSK